jgi:hypothetical protein
MCLKKGKGDLLLDFLLPDFLLSIIYYRGDLLSELFTT